MVFRNLRYSLDFVYREFHFHSHFSFFWAKLRELSNQIIHQCLVALSILRRFHSLISFPNAKGTQAIMTTRNNQVMLKARKMFPRAACLVTQVASGKHFAVQEQAASCCCCQRCLSHHDVS
jgi:hypothetical protein